MESRKKIPVGTSFFKDFEEAGIIFVDKTKFIYEFMESDSQVISISRPRLWGKTLSLTMIEYFFGSKNDEKKLNFFKSLNIGKINEGKYLEDNIGKYPVLNINFYHLNIDCEKEVHSRIKSMIKNVYRSYSYLANSNNLNEDQKNKMKKYFNSKIDNNDLEESLFFLTECLYTYHSKKVIVLINEYDHPYNSSFKDKKVHDDLSLLLTNILTKLLKDNKFLKKGLLIGKLYLAKESYLLKKINISSYGIMDEKFSEFFGYTEKEVENLLTLTNSLTYFPEVKIWYNGFCTKKSSLYNPWSVNRFISNDYCFDLYWLNCDGNQLTNLVVSKYKTKLKPDIIKLLNRKKITAKVYKNLTYEVMEQNPDSLWSILLSTGYLTFENFNENDSYYPLKVTNKETFYILCHLYRNWFKNSSKRNFSYDSISNDVSTENDSSDENGSSKYSIKKRKTKDSCSDKSEIESKITIKKQVINSSSDDSDNDDNIVSKKVSEYNRLGKILPFNESSAYLITGDIKKYVEIFNDSLNVIHCSENTFNDESSYNGFLMSSLVFAEKHHLFSKVESELNDYDIIFLPKHTNKAFIFKFKLVKQKEEMKEAAKKAVLEIDNQKDKIDLNVYSHVKKVVLIGFSCFQKKVLSAYYIHNLKKKQQTVLTENSEEIHLYKPNGKLKNSDNQNNCGVN